MFAGPADETFNNVVVSGGYSLGSSPRTIDGWSFQLINGSGVNDAKAYVDVTSQNGDTVLANNGSDKALLLNGYFGFAEAARIAASDGSEFSLVSFHIDNGYASSGDYRVVGYRDGSAVAEASQNFSALTYGDTTVTLSNSAWQYVDEFRFVRQDGSADISFYIDDIDISPAVVPNTPPIQNTNSGLALSEGGLGTISASVLDFNDAEQTDDAITYTVTGLPANGELQLDGTPLALNGTFAQTDVNNGALHYVHDGTDTLSDSFAFSVSDGAGGSITGQTFNFTIAAVDDAMVLSTEPTVTFSSPPGGSSAFDGQGGSSDVAGIALEVFFADAGRNRINSPLTFEDPYAAGSADSGLAINYAGNAGSDYVIIKSRNGGDNFWLQSLQLTDYGGNNVTIEAFDDAVSKGSVNVTVNADPWYFTFDQSGALTPSIFNNVDEIRISGQDSGVIWLTVNDLKIGAPVSNHDPTDIALSWSSVNESAGVGAAVGTLSTTDEDSGDSHSYSLVTGTGDTDNGLFSISGDSLEVGSSAVAAGSYSVRVKTDDGNGGTYQKAFAITVVDDVPPTVTDGNISISGASGTGGAYKIGDTITATWDNTGSGDNNSDTISGVTVDFSAFGGGAAVAASNSSGTWTATYTLVSGAVDGSNLNVSVTATDDAGNPATVADTSNATVDSIAPVVTDGNISISGASGTGGAYKIGDTITATWDNTGSGDNNSDTISGVTVDFSAFGGGAAVAASNSSGTWTATYTLVSGAVDGSNLNVSVTATDDAGNPATVADTSNATVDSIAPVVTDGNIAISGASGTGGAYKIGDTITATWDNTGSGDNNSDTISGVTVDFSAFGGGAAVAASNSSGTWTATYTLVSGAVDGSNLNVSVTATDDAGNTATVADASNATVDSVAPVVTDGNISISGASGTGGAYKIGDTITATWDNTGSGDNNSDTISGVTVDFSAFGGGAAVAASNSSGTWTATYTLVAGAVDGSNLNVTVTATDDAGNSTTTADTSNATVDSEAPTIAGVTAPANGTFVAGQSIVFTINFDEIVTVETSGGTPAIELTIGSDSRLATYVSGSGTSALIFRYSVQIDDEDSDGVVLDSAISLNGGTIRDAAGNDSALAFTSPDTSGVLVDAVNPTVVAITRKTPSVQITRDNPVVFEVTFSEPVTGVNASWFQTTADNGGSTTAAVSDVTGASSVYDVSVGIAGGAGDFRLDVVTPSSLTEEFATGLNTPNSMAFDTAGNLFVADDGNNTLKKIASDGTVSTFASGFSSPYGVAIDDSGNLFVSSGSEVKKVTTDGTVSTFATGFSVATAVAFDADGNLYVADYGNNNVSKVTSGGSVSVFATGFAAPMGLAFDTAGDLYVANRDNNTISKVTTGGSVSVFATGLNGPDQLAFDSAGNLYAANQFNSTVSKVTSDGTVTQYASGFQASYGLAFDSSGVLYVSSYIGHSVSRIVSPIADAAGNELADLPFTSGEPYTYDPNDAPTDIQLSNGTINESVGSGAAIGTLTSTDADSGDSHTYTLVAGTGDTDNDSFVIDGDALNVGTSALAAGSYSVRVQADDGNGGTFEKAFTVTVVDDVAPVVTSAATADGTFDAAFSYTITADGGAVSYGATGLPAGLTVDANTGEISGTPQQAGVSTVVISATDAANNTGSLSLEITIAKAAAQVALADLDVTYDATGKAVTATTTPEGLSVSITYDSQSTVPVNAGSYAVEATIDDANHAGSASGTLTIGKATLTVTANDASRSFGANNPSFTGTITGDIAADNLSASYSTPATTGSAVGTYDIVPAINDPDTKLANYDVTLNNGTLTITGDDPPVVSLGIADTVYTLGDAPLILSQLAGVTDGGSPDFDGGVLSVSVTAGGDKVPEDELTMVADESAGGVSLQDASVRVNDVEIGTYTGGYDSGLPLSVQLNTSATPATVEALIRRIAFTTTNAASMTDRFVTVQLTDGDGGTSDPATLTVALNRRPFVGADTIVTVVNAPVVTTLTRLLENDSDPDSDAFQFGTLPVTTGQGGTLSLSGDDLTYTPPNGFIGVDRFEANVEDARGGKAVAVITLKVLTDKMLAIDLLNTVDPEMAATSPNDAVVHLSGLPGKTYRVEASNDLLTWESLGQYTVDQDGLLRLIDTSTYQRAHRFFRLVEQ